MSVDVISLIMSTIMRKTVDRVNHKGKPQEADVLELVHSVMHAHRVLVHQFLRDGPHAISHVEGKVLGFFGQHPGATQRDLIERTGRDKAQLARLVKTLRELGLLAAEVDDADRRNLRLSLTADGQQVRRALGQQTKRLAKNAVAGMDTDEQRQLCALLAKVIANLAESA